MGIRIGDYMSKNMRLVDRDELDKLRQESEVLNKIKDAFKEEYETTEPWHPDKLLSYFGNSVGEILMKLEEDEV